ncbi:MAG: hypothetical protein ACOX6S_03670 [Clostridia bacterium]|jgi:hypothetical protein
MFKWRRAGVFCLGILIVLLLAGFFLLYKPDENIQDVLRVNSWKDVEHFYRQAIPGIQRAKELGLVTSIGKSFHVPGHKGKLTIDSIWYNKKEPIILYHMDQINKPVYLAGDLFLPGDEKEDVTEFWGIGSVGFQHYHGVFFNDSFYSCLRIPALKDAEARVITDIPVVIYKPYLLLEYDGKINKPGEGYGFKEIQISLEYNSDDERIDKHRLNKEINIGNGKMKFYQLDIGVSENRLYFLFNNRDKDMVYRLEGKIISDKEEVREVDQYVYVIKGYPYHYSISFEPFNTVPGEIFLELDSMYLIGNDELTFSLDPKQYKEKKTEKGPRLLKTVRNTDILLENIERMKEELTFQLSYSPTGKLSPNDPLLWWETPIDEGQKEQYERVYGAHYPLGNVVSVRNRDLEKSYVRDLGARQKIDGSRISLSLPFRYINPSDEIDITISNLTYRWPLDEKIPMEIRIPE